MRRSSQSVTLEDGSTLPYDLLVLTPGLENATLATVRASGVRGACAPSDLPSIDSANVQRQQGDISAEALQAAHEAGQIVVYGDTVEAYVALAALEAAGVDLVGTVDVVHTAVHNEDGEDVATGDGEKVTEDAVVHYAPPGHADGAVQVMHEVRRLNTTASYELQVAPYTDAGPGTHAAHLTCHGH